MQFHVYALDSGVWNSGSVSHSSNPAVVPSDTLKSSRGHYPAKNDLRSFNLDPSRTPRLELKISQPGAPRFVDWGRIFPPFEALAESLFGR
jgi:hypothetical protein